MHIIYSLDFNISISTSQNIKAVNEARKEKKLKSIIISRISPCSVLFNPGDFYFMIFYQSIL